MILPTRFMYHVNARPYYNYDFMRGFVKIFMDLMKIQERESGLGAEHPLWDRLQNVLVLFFFAALFTDGLSSIYFGRSTVLASVLSFPILILPALFFFAFGIYLAKESHKTIFTRNGRPSFIDFGVYSHLRHPMYLGGLLILLGILFAEFSIIAFVAWMVLFIACDWMATYEEKDLVRTLGEEYINYQKKVPKWFPKF